MKVLIFEYITGGGLAGEPIPESLWVQGDLMIQALVADLLGLKGVELKVMRDARLTPVVGRLQNLLVNSPADLEQVWSAALVTVDACWIIAPETHNTLEKFSRQVEEAGVRLLNSAADAVALTASKSQTFDVLARHGVLVVDHYPFTDQMVDKWVVKPDKSAGCEKLQIFSTKVEAEQWLSIQSVAQKWLLQPWIDGDSLSLSLICKQGNAIVLSVNRQEFVELNGIYTLNACTVNVEAVSEEFVSLARKITEAIPGLWGYVGVDLVRTDAGPVVIEVNPRLTTSYVGIRKAIGVNPAAVVLSLLEQPLPYPVKKYNGNVVKVVIPHAG